MLIDRFMPAFDAEEQHTIDILAPAERVYPAIRHTDLSRSVVIRILFAVRGLPRLFGRATLRRRILTLDEFLRSGFVVLAEEPGVELVVGLVGAPWQPRGGLVSVTPDEFERFTTAGYAKMVWTFHVAPRSHGVRVTTVTRVHATDATARRRFLRYWRVVGPFSGLIRREILRLLKADTEGASARRDR